MYGNIMQYALCSGFRVITPDLPHDGMSGRAIWTRAPRAPCRTRTTVVHEFVVNQLGVKRAAYLGHSLGGQLVVGYALSWPEAV
jgi:homoserine O-acetyltransferase